MQQFLSMPVGDLGKDCIVNVAKTSMSSKIIGAYPFHNITLSNEFHVYILINFLN